MQAHVIDVSIRSLVLALLAAIILTALGRCRTSALQHAIWAAVVCGMLALFAFGWALPRLPLPVMPPAPVTPAPKVIDTTTTTPRILNQVEAPVPLPAKPHLSIDWSEVAMCAYAAITFAFLAQFATGMFLAWRLLEKSAHGQGFFESAAIAVPVTVGWLRPRILLPAGWTEWDGEKLEAVLAHEGSHARRRDGLIAALAGVNRCIFWFHPLAWWLEQRLRLLAELACDEWCVAMLGDRERYARLLLDMARVADGAHGRLQQHALTMAASSHIRQRIDSILKEGRTFSLGLRWTGWAAIALCAVPVILGAGTVTLDRATPLPPLLWQQQRFTAPASPPPQRRLLAQTQSAPSPARKTRLKFEVASVRPVGPAPALPIGGGDGGGGRGAGGGGTGCRGFNVDAGRVDVTCSNLPDLISRAYDVFVGRVMGPEWLRGPGSPRFNISAKLPQGASREQVPEMLQALLEDRFKLAVHRETKEEPGLGLVVAKGGPRLTQAAPGADAAPPALGPDGKPLTLVQENRGGIAFMGAHFPNPDGPGDVTLMTTPDLGLVRLRAMNASRHSEAPNIDAQGLADLLTMECGVPVVDMTGLKGRYNVTLDINLDALAAIVINPGESMDPVKDALLDAVQDALKKYGLHLEPRKTPVEYLVVDHLERTPTEN